MKYVKMKTTEGHKTKNIEGMLTKPIAIQVNGHEGRRDGEVVDQRVQLHQEQQLLGGRDELFGKIPSHQG